MPLAQRVLDHLHSHLKPKVVGGYQAYLKSVVAARSEGVPVTQCFKTAAQAWKLMDESTKKEWSNNTLKAKEGKSTVSFTKLQLEKVRPASWPLLASCALRCHLFQCAGASQLSKDVTAIVIQGLVDELQRNSVQDKPMTFRNIGKFTATQVSDNVLQVEVNMKKPTAKTEPVEKQVEEQVEEQVPPKRKRKPAAKASSKKLEAADPTLF
ncbi:MAG: hypothetical protein SGPRY_008821 [Prymnesium sp.]